MPDSGSTSQVIRRVLVVEDDYQLAEVVAEVLTYENCEPDLAANGMEALDRLRAYADYDAIICDVMMPRIGGEAFYEEVAQKHPHLADKILFITGQSAVHSGMTDFISRTNNQLLQKPFDIEQLRTALHDLLHR
jgi:CheY-like chemotaxis protein